LRRSKAPPAALARDGGSIVDAIDALEDPSDPAVLIALVHGLRPPRAGEVAAAADAVRALAARLQGHAAAAAALRGYLAAILEARQHRYLYADTGISRPESLRQGLARCIGAKLLPPAPHRGYLRDLFLQLFDRPDDHAWIQAVPLADWQALFDTLRIDDAPDHPGFERARREIVEAMHLLAARLQALAGEAEIIRLHADEPSDPAAFRALAAQVRGFARSLGGEPGSAEARLASLQAAIAECDREFARWRRLMMVHGTTTRLTQQLLGAGQMLARLRVLAQLVAPRNAAERFERGLRLFQKLVEEQNRETSVRHLWRRATNLLALQVTEQAGRTGEHYVANGRTEWIAMFRAAFGAGLIVGLMALAKIGIVALHLPPLWSALAVSLNYALGFVVVHLLHFTIATKQPAMTAALIASTLRTDRRGRRSVSRLANLVVAILRTQLVAIAGNVLAAFPTAVGLYYLVTWLSGPGWIDAGKAGHLVGDQDPVASLALVHAAIAGVCLFLSGVVSGYYDNLTAVSRVPDRVRRAPWLAWLPQRRRDALARYVENNLGALAGNTVFGFLLGMTGFVGMLLGAPIDIRHVTFSAANLAYGSAALGWALDWHAFVVPAIGVMLIGLVNLGVSFTLALVTALRASGVRLADEHRLWELLWRRLKRNPLAFLRPPPREPAHRR